MLYNKQSRQDGMSLLSVLMALAISGVVLLGTNQMITNAMAGQNHVQQGTDKQAIARHFLNATSCSETLNPTLGCTPGALVAVKRKLKDGSVAILASDVGSGTKYDRWTVRAECSSSGDGVILRAARLKDSGTLRSTADSDFSPDPLTRKIVKWSDGSSRLLPTGIELCGTDATSKWVNIDAGGVQGSNHVWYANDGVDHSPLGICKRAGFRSYSGACRFKVNNSRIMVGSTGGNTEYGDGIWAISCMYGNGAFYFSATGQSEVLCVN